MASDAAAAFERLRRLGRLRGPLRLRDDVGRLLPVIIPVSVGGAVLLVAALAAIAIDLLPLTAVLGLLTLLVAAVIAEAFPVPIEGVAAGRTSLATIFIVGGGVIYGWAAAALLGFVTMTAVEVARRRPFTRVGFNAGLYTLAAGAGGAAASIAQDNDLTSLFLGAVFGSTAFYVVDIALLTAVLARSSRTAFLPSYARAMYSTLLPFGIMASLTVILVVLWDRSPFVAVALIGPLVAIALYQRWVHGALDRLRELDRLKNEFIAIVSHELRTPIASVYGAAVTLQRAELDRERRDSLLSVIYGESARLARLVDQVLWASRLEAGHTDTALERCDPAELAADVVEAARAHLPENLALELRAEAALPSVAADREKLKQVLVNLIENAVKYSPEGGRIDVTLSRTHGSVCFAIRDEGIGIPPEEQARIFDKFHRLDPNLTRGVGGSGLGLYISHELVQQMDGRIWVDSREGSGSTFRFELPLA
jgi:signal transduction histidine kinase